MQSSKYHSWKVWPWKPKYRRWNFVANNYVHKLRCAIMQFRCSLDVAYNFPPGIYGNCSHGMVAPPGVNMFTLKRSNKVCQGISISVRSWQTKYLRNTFSGIRSDPPLGTQGLRLRVCIMTKCLEFVHVTLIVIRLLTYLLTYLHLIDQFVCIWHAAIML